jgi:Spy/CpxP family protein refolding chaperone
MNTLRIFIGFLFICFASAAAAADQQESKQGQTQSQSQISQQGKVEKNSQAQSRERKRMGRRIWWHRDDVIEKLKLTEAQIKQLDAIFQSAKTEQGELRTKASQLGTELNEQLTRTELDDKQFMETLEEYNQIRAKMYGASILTKYNMRKVLTPEQLKTALEEYPAAFSTGFSGRRPSKMKRRSRGPGGENPPAPPSAQQK